jgi:signal transduction histidine kinase/ActR/RegA family two-component response regulator
MIYTLHAAARCYFIPSAVVAFSAPPVLCSFVIIGTLLPGPFAPVGVFLIALHAVTSLRLLRRNWSSFSHSIDIEIERGRLAAMLHEQKEIAERAVQLKTRFLASASHDLRQPMHAISLYLDGLAEADVSERARIAISDARVCAHDMNDMFRSLLDISRLDAHQAVPAMSAFSIGDVLSQVEKEMTPLAKSRGVGLKVRPCAGHVYSDRVMIERIALNLVSNAVRHTRSGGRVLVACRMRGGLLRLAVYDTGIGIPELQQKEIFEEFHRLDTSQPHDETGGLGLGLAIVRRLAQVLHLPITLQSTPGRGSMFAVDMQLLHVARPRRGRAPEETKLADRLAIVVDDDVPILRAVSFILESLGCEVICARSWPELEELLASSVRVPDFIICDYELNEKTNGLDVIKLLREEFNCDIPAILVTGNTGAGVAERSARELAIPVLYKPLEASVLRGSLENLLVPEEQ